MTQQSLIVILVHSAQPFAYVLNGLFLSHLRTFQTSGCQQLPGQGILDITQVFGGHDFRGCCMTPTCVPVPVCNCTFL